MIVIIFFVGIILFLLVSIFKGEQKPILTHADFPRRIVFFLEPPLPYARQAVIEAARIINQCVRFKIFEERVTIVLEKDTTALNISFHAGEKHRLGKHHETFDGPGGVLAHATLNGNELCVDSTEPWTEKYLIRVMIHEMLHSIGLVHSTELDSIMYYKYNPKINKPSKSDIAKIKKLYPFMRNTTLLNH